MRCRIVDMRCKEVIHIKTGLRIGYVCDVEIDTVTARLIGIVIHGRPRCFGLLGREEDIIIRWEEIEIIGCDTILVNPCISHPKQKNRFPFLNKFFRM